MTQALPALVAGAAGMAASGSLLEALPLVNAAQASVERAFPLPGSDGVVMDQGSGVIVVRRNGQVFALSRVCPHEQGELRWRDADVRYQCPRHESKFQVDGTLISGRAKRNMDRLPIRREGTTVKVDTSRPIRSDRQAAEWAAAVITV